MAERSDSSAEYAVALARGFGGAVLFAFPLLMTMEMWSLGLHVDRLRLLIFLGVNLVMVLGLGWFVGFERAARRRDLVFEAFAAYGIGILASAIMLLVFGILKTGMSTSEIIGKIAVQAIPASLGAALARKQLALDVEGEEVQERDREDRARYPGQLFLMAAGAIYISFNVAPTEEMLLIAFKMTPARTLGLVLLSVAVLHAFVYSVGFKGQEPQAEMSFPRVFLSYTLAGYAVALCVSIYVLWTFERFEGVSPPQVAAMVTVLGFPAALGAAVARLVV